MVLSTDNQQLFQNTELLQNIELNTSSLCFLKYWKLKSTPELHKWILNTFQQKGREEERERKPSSMSAYNFRDDLYLSTLTEEKWIKLQNSRWGTWIRNKARKTYTKPSHVCKGNGISDVEGPYIPMARELEDWRGSSCEGTTAQQVTHPGHLPTDYPHQVPLCCLNTQAICLSTQPAPSAPSISWISLPKWHLYMRQHQSVRHLCLLKADWFWHSLLFVKLLL